VTQLGASPAIQPPAYFFFRRRKPADPCLEVWDSWKGDLIEPMVTDTSSGPFKPTCALPGARQSVTASHDTDRKAKPAARSLLTTMSNSFGSRKRRCAGFKAQLIAWWATEASREQVASDQADVQTPVLNGEVDTPVIDLGLSSDGVVVERRQLALCEAPNRAHKLANQVDHFLKHCLESSHAVPARKPRRSQRENAGKAEFSLS
jgi:hypothetical protein